MLAGEVLTTSPRARIELLRQLPAAGGSDDALLRRLNLLTVNGIAGGLRDTG